MATDLEQLAELFYQAAQWRAKIDDPYGLESPEAALDAVRGFMATEDKILSQDNILAILPGFVTEPLDSSGRKLNHAMMAGLIMARSGLSTSARILLDAAQHEDDWCATQARLNLNWLTPATETAEVLQHELAGNSHTGLDQQLLVTALIHQRRVIDIPIIEQFITDNNDSAKSALVLASYVGLFPVQGLQFALKITEVSSATLATTALGLRAIYGDEASYHALLTRCEQRNGYWHTALRWLGRTGQPDALPLLLEGLEHPNSATRADLLTSLAWYGDQLALRTLIHALDDNDNIVSDQALSLVLYWLGAEGATVTQNWRFDEDGNLTNESRRYLASTALKRVDQLEPGIRYGPNGEQLKAEHLLDNLYLGIQPEHSWYHWISMTGVYGPYDTHMDILYNYPCMEDMEQRLLKHAKSD